MAELNPWQNIGQWIFLLRDWRRTVAWLRTVWQLPCSPFSRLTRSPATVTRKLNWRRHQPPGDLVGGENMFSGFQLDALIMISLNKHS